MTNPSRPMLNPYNCASSVEFSTREEGARWFVPLNSRSSLRPLPEPIEASCASVPGLLASNGASELAIIGKTVVEPRNFVATGQVAAPVATSLGMSTLPTTSKASTATGAYLSLLTSLFM